MKTKRKTRTQLVREADKLFSMLIRKRGHCQRCLKTENLQCAHVVSRTNKLLRWNPDNALSLCTACHLFWMHKSPLEFVEWYKKEFPINYAFLMREKNNKEYNLGQSIEFTIKSLKEAMNLV